MNKASVLDVGNEHMSSCAGVRSSLVNTDLSRHSSRAWPVSMANGGLALIKSTHVSLMHCSPFFSVPIFLSFVPTAADG